MALLLGLTSCTAQRKPVQNVIYLIGDGMGFGAVSSLLLSESEVTGFEMAPVIGLNETCSANNYVTDSPAGGTVWLQEPVRATDTWAWIRRGSNLKVS